ncbi:MAG: hypothetical protein GF364_02530 [Candidatus Lokiarchaeota archaeon]|nr:hypothetical protein [Candidatus Lokiarchaeota archaeon]
MDCPYRRDILGMAPQGNDSLLYYYWRDSCPSGLILQNPGTEAMDFYAFFDWCVLFHNFAFS